MTNQVAPCGIDCVNCELFEANQRHDIWQRMADMMKKTPDEVKCKGCREQGGCTIHADCETLACITEKGHQFCHECQNFPCTLLMPAADGAERLPHNLKVFNLCTIKRDGLEAFLKTAPANRARYFTGRMKLGSGPQLPEA